MLDLLYDSLIHRKMRMKIIVIPDEARIPPPKSLSYHVLYKRFHRLARKHPFLRESVSILTDVSHRRANRLDPLQYPPLSSLSILVSLLAIPNILLTYIIRGEKSRPTFSFSRAISTILMYWWSRLYEFIFRVDESLFCPIEIYRKRNIFDDLINERHSGSKN